MREIELRSPGSQGEKDKKNKNTLYIRSYAKREREEQRKDIVDKEKERVLFT